MRSVRGVSSRTSGRVVRAAVVAALLVAVVSCGGDDDPADDASPSTPGPGDDPTSASTTGVASSDGEPVTAVPTTQPPTTTVPPTPITLAFAGDTYGLGLEGDVAAGIAERLAPMRPVLDAADLAVLNLETAITDRGVAAPKQFAFRTDPGILDGIAVAGVDAVSMANNHGMDFGVDGLVDSLAARAASPIPVVGIGEDEDDALAPAIFDVRGTTVAVLGATQVLDDSVIDSWTANGDQPGLASAKRVDELVTAVSFARAAADVVVVFLHWGVEGESCPTSSQADLAQALAGAGAAVVVGGHAHRVQGGGWLDSTYVDYGLGNFAFKAVSPAAQATGVLTLTVEGGRVTQEQWTPGVIQGSTPVPLEGADADVARQQWLALRDCTGLAAQPA